MYLQIIKMRYALHILLIVTVLAFFFRNVSSIEPQARERLLVKGIEYYPDDLENSLGRAFERMLYTRLSRYFEVEDQKAKEGDAWPYTLELSLTRIGDGISIDILLTDKVGEKKKRYLTGKNTGEIPGLLEDLSSRLRAIAYGKDISGKTSVASAVTVTPETKGDDVPLRLSNLLPSGKLRFSPSFGGGYFRFSGGDVNLDGKDEVVAVGDDGITVVSINEDALLSLYTYELKKDERVLSLSCGDINRDRSSEIVSTIVGDYGVKGLVVFFDPAEKKFVPVVVENVFLKTFNGENGTFLLSQSVLSGGKLSGKLEINRLEGTQIEVLQAIHIEEGISIEFSTLVWFNGSYAVLEYGGGAITLREEKRVTTALDGIVEDIRTIDLDGDGNQEVMVFLSMIGKSGFFESLSVKKGFAVEVYRIAENGFQKDYRFENETLEAGGFFPRFSSSRGVKEFVVIALQGNDFYPPSIKWKEVRVH